MSINQDFIEVLKNLNVFNLYFIYLNLVVFNHKLKCIQVGCSEMLFLPRSKISMVLKISVI